MAELLSIDYWNKNFPGIVQNLSAAKSWAGSWVDDLCSRLAVQFNNILELAGFENVSAAPTDTSGGGGSSIESAGEGGSSPSMGMPPMMMDVGSADIVVPQVPSDIGTGRGGSIEV